MFFFVRNRAYTAGLPFRRFLSHGHEGITRRWPIGVAPLDPLPRGATQALPRGAERRLCRSALPALPALWKGILYDASALDAAWDLVRRWSYDERLRHREDAARLALDAPVPGKRYSSAELAKELLDISLGGLATLAKERGHESEALYLEPLERLTRRGRCPADDTLEQLKAAPTGSRDLVARTNKALASDALTRALRLSGVALRELADGLALADGSSIVPCILAFTVSLSSRSLTIS